MNSAVSGDPDIAQALDVNPDENISRTGNISLGEASRNSASSQQHSTGSRSLISLRRQYRAEKKAREAIGGVGGDHPPLLEIPEEIYAVRKAALRVLKPLTKTWVRR